MKTRILFSLILFSTLKVVGQTDSSKHLKPVDLFEIKYAGVKDSERNMYLTREDLEAIEMRMAQFYYNKDKVDQRRVVYSVLALYDEYIKATKQKEVSFQNFIEYLRKK